ncbi:MAG: Crp/Fnr family transcriptional regulator [Erysipelotrichaceae bacterium]|nr:Crp/Fnr family transcriptional regulator [Erysipelotrichaceae bacterium]
MNKLINILSQEEIKKVKITSYPKDEVIYHEDDICEEVTIVLEGVIEISSFSFQGLKMIYNTVLPNQLLGNNLIFSSDPRYKGNVICKTKCKVASIKKDNLVDIIRSNKEFLNEYLKIQSDFGKTLNEKIKILNFKSAEERLFYYLKIRNNQIKVNSIAYLAKELFLSREATSRLVSSLVNKGIISKDIINNAIIITSHE